MKSRLHAIVVEVDTAAIPTAERYRISPEQPVLWLGTTRRDPDRYVERLVAGEAGREELRMPGALTPRPDLYEHYSSFSDRSWDRRRPAILRRLYDAGHGVHGRRQYRVYVGDLAPSASGRPRVYVGQTSKPIAQRWLEHRTGARTATGKRLASSVVERHGGALRPDLYEHLAVLPTKTSSVEQERQVAHALSLAGYEVKGDGIRTAPTSNEHVRADATLAELLAEHLRVIG